MKIAYTAGALLAVLGLATATMAQTTKNRGSSPQRSHHKYTLVPTTAPVPSPEAMYYPVGYTGPRDGSDLRTATVVYDNTAGGYYIATDPAPGGNPPFNGLMEGVRFPAPPNWQNGSLLTLVTTVYRKHVATSESFFVVVRLFDTIDTTVVDPGNINLTQIGTTVAFGPVTNAGAVGNYLLNLNTTAAWPGVPDNTLAIDFKYVLSTATPGDYLNPAFLSANVNANFFTTQGGSIAAPNAPAIGTEYPTPDVAAVIPNFGCWVDQNDPVGPPVLLRNGDYQASEFITFNADPDTANLYLRVTADVVQPAPANDNCASAIAIPPPASGGSAAVNGSTNGVTVDAGIVYCAGLPVNPAGVWYSYAGQGRMVTINTCDAATAAYDAIISVFSGTCVGGLVCVNANNDVGNGLAFCGPAQPIGAQITFCADVGTTYLIFVRANGNTGGSFKLNLIDSGTACSQSCALSAPAGAVLETDCFATDVNGTCASAVTVAPCTSVYGQVEGIGGSVDGDTYYYDVPVGDTGYILKFQSEYPAFVNIQREANIAAPCQFITVNAGGQLSTAACLQNTVSVVAPGGDRHIITVTTPNGNSPNNCGGAGSHYILRLESVATPCATGPDCFDRGPLDPGNPPNGHIRPSNAGHFSRGGPNGVNDTTECFADWDGNGLIEPADVAAFVLAWFYSANNPPNLDGDIDCNGSAEPADVAAFVTPWFSALTTPGSGGCP